mgnify:CR=1 FL=1
MMCSSSPIFVRVIASNPDPDKLSELFGDKVWCGDDVSYPLIARDILLGTLSDGFSGEILLT